MKGVYKVKLMDDGGIPDAVWREACRAREVRKLLDGRRTFLEARSENLVFDNFAAFIFNKLFSGGDISDPYDFDSGSAWLATIMLSNVTSDPTYQEASNQFAAPSTMSGTVNSASAGKRFIEDDADTPEIIVDPNGRHAVIYRSRFLWTPLQGVSNDIFSIATFMSQNADNLGNDSRGIASRTRLVDSQGRKIRISKTNRQVLLVEYEFTLVAI